jgi:hypothetical protein
MIIQSVVVEKSLPLEVRSEPLSIRQGDTIGHIDQIIVDQSVGYANSWEATPGQVKILKSELPALIKVLQEML